MIKYIIIDDEQVAHRVIKDYADRLPNMKLLQSCYDAFEAIEYLSEHEADLIFLDLNMPKLKGFEFLKTLSEPPKVIVTTAYKEHALEGFELNVTDYLLKPFSFERFLKAVNKLKSPAGDRPSISSKTGSEEERVFFRTENKHVQVSMNDILFIEASGNYSKIVTADQTITIREKISELQEQLPGERFIQVHRSFIVSIKQIQRIAGNSITINKHEIPIGKVYKMNVNKLLK